MSFEGDDYAFSVFSVREGGGKISANLGGVDVNLLVDSGASANIVDAETWDHLKMKHVKCTSKAGSHTNLYAYGSDRPLDVKGMFTCEV